MGLESFHHLISGDVDCIVLSINSTRGDIIRDQIGDQFITIFLHTGLKVTAK